MVLNTLNNPNPGNLKLSIICVIQFTFIKTDRFSEGSCASLLDYARFGGHYEPPKKGGRKKQAQINDFYGLSNMKYKEE